MKRFIIYIAGLNLIAAAVVLNIRYDLGVAAFSSVMYAVAEIHFARDSDDYMLSDFRLHAVRIVEADNADVRA